MQILKEKCILSIKSKHFHVAVQFSLLVLLLHLCMLYFTAVDVEG